MSSTDFAHSTLARDNRYRKARLLRLAAIAHGLAVEELAALIDPNAPKAAAVHRRAIRKTATLDREPSGETWQAALVELERAPARMLTVVPPPCGCTPHPETGVLYETLPADPAETGYRFLGWPCQHPDDYVKAAEPEPAPPAEIPTDAFLCTRGGKQPTEKDLAVVAEFAAFLRDDQATRPDSEPARPIDTVEPAGDAEWWL